MFNQRFFTSKLGHAALVSVTAMVAFVILASLQQDALAAQPALVAVPMVELA